MKKILITGGAGFIGFHLAKHLLAAKKHPLSITLVDNLQRGAMDRDFKQLIEQKGVSFLELDLTSPDSFKKIGGGFTEVYHLAAVNGTKTFYENPAEVIRINTLSTIFILEWLRKENKNAKFLFTSSNEAYAGGLNAFNSLPIPTPEEVPLVIEDPYNPRWSYAGTKLLGELSVIHYASAYDLKAIIVRPHNFYGPRAGYGGHVIPELCERIIKKADPFPLFGVEETRSFCHVKDAVRAMALLMESKALEAKPIETVHIGSKEETRIKDLAHLLFEIAGWKPKNIESKKAPKGSVKRRLAKISKLEALTGWKAEIPLEKGLKETYDWYKANPKKGA